MLNLIVCLGVILATADTARVPMYQYTVHKILATWSEAKLQCHREGGVLASPTDSKERLSLHALMKPDKTYYIGIRESYLTGTYVSVEGIPLENMTEAMDNMIQELDSLDGDCMAIKDNDNIIIVPCWSRLQYICKLNTGGTNHRTRTNLPGTFDANKISCGPSVAGYKYMPLSHKCFKVHEIRQSWEQASATCISEGGQLAVIEDENDKESALSAYDFKSWFSLYVGIIDRSGEGDWKSEDGTPVELLYNVWQGANKPSYEKQMCGEIGSSGKLIATPCGGRPFLCERDPILKVTF